MKSDKIFYSLIFLIALTTISWITACKHEADISNFPEICFARDVLPVYGNNCAITGCHDGTGEMIPLSSYSDIRNSVVPFNPDKSSSYKAIISKWGENHMPPGKALPEDKRIIIRVWIEQGANETLCPAAASANVKSNDRIRN